MISFIWYLIIGGILGWLAGVILGKDVLAASSGILLQGLSVLGLVVWF